MKTFTQARRVQSTRRRFVLLACAVLAVVVGATIIPACVTQQQPDGTVVTRLDRDAIRAELTPLLDDVDAYLREVGEGKAADQIKAAREVARSLLNALDQGTDGEVTNWARQLDRVANAAIGLIPDAEKRLLARGGYYLVRRAIIRSGIVLPITPPGSA